MTRSTPQTRAAFRLAGTKAMAAGDRTLFLLWSTIPGPKTFNRYGYQDGSCWMCFNPTMGSPAPANIPATHMFRCVDVCSECVEAFPDLSGDFHVLVCDQHAADAMAKHDCPHGVPMRVSEPVRLP